MSDERREQISAMVDGELGEDGPQAVNALLQTPALRRSWASYHLISDSLQQQLPAAVDTELAAKIAATIEKEPAILAPRTSNSRTYLKPVAGFAIAASVAAIAILGIQHNQQQSPQKTAPVVTFTAPAAPEAALSVAAVETPSDAQLQQVKADARARLNSYLVNYNEYRTNSGLQGMLPYARTVTFENNQ